MSLMQMSISAALLITATVLIRVIGLNKLPKTTFLILWGAVIIRLLVPVSIPGQFSFYSAVRNIINTVEPMPVTESVLTIDDRVIQETRNFVEPAAQGYITSITPFTIIWFIGMFVAFIFFVIIYFKSHRNLRFATLISDNDFLNEWQKSHRLMRSIAIMQSDKIKTPVAVGLIKPKIILPKCINMNDTQLLDHVLLHEYCHIKRFDALWKILMVVALCVHWFNPFVWIMFILANRDLELTCDEMVLHHFGTETKTAYAYSIIGMAEQKNKFASFYNGFSKNAAVERIESIMKLKKSSFLSRMLAFMLVVTLSIGALTVFAESPQTSTENTLSEAALEKLSAIIEEAGVVILPYELRGRLPVHDAYGAVRLMTDINPEIDAWINEKVQAGTPFLLGYPTALFYDPYVYALLMEGASWSEIMDFVRERAMEQLEREGHTVFRMDDIRFTGIPLTDITGEIPGFILADDFVGFDVEEIFATIDRYRLRIINLDELDEVETNIIPLFPVVPIDPGDRRLWIMPQNH